MRLLLIEAKQALAEWPAREERTGNGTCLQFPCGSKRVRSKFKQAD